MKKILFLISIFFLSMLSAQSDCISAVPVCGNSPITYNPQGPGTIMEPTNPSCLADEHFSAWYTFTIATSGTLEFTITPDDLTDDYDFALYGPNFNCSTGNFGNPIRCNFSGTPGLTGLGMGATNPNGGGGGAPSQWSSILNVVAGETYILLVDNYLPPPVLFGFSLTWGGTATLTSPFTPAIQPNPFIQPGPTQNGHVLICSSPQIFDFSTLSTGILNNNPNFSINYYTTSNNAITNTSPITTPINVNTTTTYYYAISYTDPANPNNPTNKCKEFGEINFDSGAISVNSPTIFACNNNNTGIGTFDISTATNQIYNDPTATVVYYNTLVDLANNTNPITNLTSYTTPPKQIFAEVTTTQGCTNTATVNLELSPLLALNNITLTACNNNNSGTAYYDLTTANVYPANPTAPKKYFPTVTDLLNGTNEITTPTYYLSAQGSVYVEVTGLNGCKNYIAINLEFYPAIPTQEATLTECFLPLEPTKAEFDLTTATVTTLVPNTKTFYASLQDAINGTNAIANPNVYKSVATSVFVRIFDGNGCWNIAKINLVVTPPSYSSVLVDKVICIEDRTTLDAGPGFTAYSWSTGATTQVASNIGVGEYWVNLTKDGCVTRQTVKVYASPNPVITNLDITNNTITVTVAGGVTPYKYSLDGTNWQDSNVFTNVPRGEAVIYVKDDFDCEPIVVGVTVPNLVNAISPNDDTVNDYLDYSALYYKKDLVFTIYDRYGTKIFEGDKKNLYRWDGRSGSKKVLTGTYWYTITWKEPATDAPVKYSGWILVKNRD